MRRRVQGGEVIRGERPRKIGARRSSFSEKRPKEEGGKGQTVRPSGKN